jgi:hypothetical protein
LVFLFVVLHVIKWAIFGVTAQEPLKRRNLKDLTFASYLGMTLGGGLLYSPGLKALMDEGTEDLMDTTELQPFLLPRSLVSLNSCALLFILLSLLGKDTI